jgi:hypothetical protein
MSVENKELIKIRVIRKVNERVVLLLYKASNKYVRVY